LDLAKLCAKAIPLQDCRDFAQFASSQETDHDWLTRSLPIHNPLEISRLRDRFASRANDGIHAFELCSISRSARPDF
jgi:hypothetical protein